MKTVKIILLVTVSALLMAGCASVKVVTDSKAGTDFSQFTTYQVIHFAPEEAQQNQSFRLNQLNRDRVDAAINRNADARGMREVESDPDVLLLYASDVNIEQSYTSRTDYMGGPYWGYRGGYYMGGPSYTTTDVNTFYIGKLTIAIVEPESKDLLWYGQGTKEVSGDGSKAEENINMVVDKIMEQFPIGAPAE
jgi:hypothetical protein